MDVDHLIKTPVETRMSALFVAFIAFMLISTALVSFLEADFHPQPFYDRLSVRQYMQEIHITADEHLTLEIYFAEKVPARILVSIYFASNDRPLQIVARGADSGKVLGALHANASGLHRLNLKGAKPGQKIKLEFSSEAFGQKAAPSVYRSGKIPSKIYDAKITKGDSDDWPLIFFEYEWASDWLLFLWLPTLFLFIIAILRRRFVYAYLVLLGVSATITSVFFWQYNYNVVYSGHRDADGRGKYAENLAHYIKEPKDRENLQEWFHNYPHTQTALAPVLMAIPISFGLSRDLSYILFSSYCGFISVVMMFWILGDRLRCSHMTGVLLITGFVCHPLSLRAFARPITDQLGLLTTVLMFAILTCEFKPRKPHRILLLLLVFILPLSRPQGFSYWPFIALTLGTGIIIFEKRFALKEIVVVFFRIFLLPLFGIAFLYLYFDWFHNVDLMFKKAAIFQRDFTWGLFWKISLGTFQLFPIIWLFIRREKWKTAPVLLSASWFIWYLTMLVVLKAPMWIRHLTPLLPGIVILSATAIEGRQGLTKLVLVGIVLTGILANVGIVLYQIPLIKHPPGWLFNMVI